MVMTAVITRRGVAQCPFNVTQMDSSWIGSSVGGASHVDGCARVAEALLVRFVSADAADAAADDESFD